MTSTLLSSEILGDSVPKFSRFSGFIEEQNFIEEHRIRRLWVEQDKLIASETTRWFGSEQIQRFSSHVVSARELCARTEILKYALCNAVKMFRLSDEYACLLQDKVSPEDYDEAMDDYKEIAEHYVRTPRDLAAREIAREAKIVLDALDEELGSDELADILNLDVMAVENALTEYSVYKVYVD